MQKSKKSKRKNNITKMNINCIICSDLFLPNSEIYTTSCGHIFHYTCLLNWLERSKSCPQCRNKVTMQSIHRLYFNVASSEGIKEDVSVLQHRVDGLSFQLQLKDKDIQNYTEKYRKLKVQKTAFRSEIQRLEQIERTHESAMAALKDQIKFFKSQSINCDKLREEIIHLKSQIKDTENVQIAINGSRKQVEDIIRNENNIESLALLASMLKKSLVEAERKKKDLQYKLKLQQNELSEYKRTMTQTQCEYEDMKRQLESLKLNYEKEVKYLKNKFSQLEEKILKGDKSEAVNNSIRRITLESPVNFDRTPVLLSNKSKIINLTENSRNASLSELDICRNDMETEFESIIVDSPLLATNSGLLETHKSRILRDPNKFSIFKNKLPSKVEPTKLNRASSDTSYDGFGSSIKEDIYPGLRNRDAGVKRPKTMKLTSAKYKKLSAEAGKSKKMSDFFSQ